MKTETVAKKRTMRNDFLLIGIFLLAAILGLIYLFCFRKTGDTVTVTVGGQMYKTFSLSQNITEDIRTGENGEQLNRLVIQDGKVHVETATCPDGVCVAHAPIFRDGESIVCLPQQVVITVTAQNGDAPDIIV